MKTRLLKRTALLLLLGLTSLSAARLSEIKKIKVGDSPTYAAMSPDGRLLFVANFASDEISVIDTATRRTTKEFYGGHEPVGIAVTPDGNKIFVTNLAGGLVKVIDARTYEIEDDIKVGDTPSNITISPRGQQAFVTNYGRGKIGRVDFIDTSTHRVLGEVEVGVRPLAAVVSELEDRLYVVCGGSNDLYIIDIAQRQVIETLLVGQGPDGLALSPDGNTLYVSNSGSHDVSIVDLLDLKEVRREKVGSKPFSIAVNQNGFIFVVESGDETLSLFSPDFEKVSSVKVGDRPIDVELSPDERFAYVTAEQDNRVLVYEIADN
jgi:YVTN family beta-propeller protein